MGKVIDPTDGMNCCAQGGCWMPKQGEVMFVVVEFKGSHIQSSKHQISSYDDVSVHDGVIEIFDFEKQEKIFYPLISIECAYTQKEK